MSKIQQVRYQINGQNRYSDASRGKIAYLTL